MDHNPKPLLDQFQRTVGEVVRDDPGAREVMADMGINHCCGAHLTLGEAAGAAGVPLDALLDALSRRRERPAALRDVPEARQVHLDVRADIARGGEPFVRIMTAVRSLGIGAVLVVRAPFEPVPLYDVLGKRGFAHWTERRAADDWSIWFYRGAAPATGNAPTPPVGDGRGDRSVLDVRGLEPPEPMVRVLQVIEWLTPGAELEVRHDRRPTFLYPQLEERGFVHETDEPEPGLVRIRIRRGESR